jgi:hypothetical protein
MNHLGVGPPLAGELVLAIADHIGGAEGESLLAGPWLSWSRGYSSTTHT